MSETIGQPGDPALPRPLGIGEILNTARPSYTGACPADGWAGS
jgi:hypothetical protein